MVDVVAPRTDVNLDDEEAGRMRRVKAAESEAAGVKLASKRADENEERRLLLQNVAPRTDDDIME